MYLGGASMAGDTRQAFWRLLPHQRMLPSNKRLLIDAHGSDIHSYCLFDLIVFG